jgi:hypothetical protein
MFTGGIIKDTTHEKGFLMSRTRNIPVFLLLFVLLCTLPGLTPVMSQDKHQGFWRLVQTVQDILAGKNAGQAQTFIPPGAQIIFGSRVANLKAVVAGEIPSCALADTSYHGVGINARTNDSEDMGYIVLKTVKSDTTIVRYHTIVFIKDSTGQYKVSSWQAGN